MSAICIAAGAPHRERPTRPARPARPARAVGGRAGVPRPAVRLTRRGRAVVVLLLLAVVFGALVSLRAPADAAGERGDAPVAERVTIQPGETLWQIARRAAPGVDPRATVARIKDMNGLGSSVVQAGQALLVPAAG
jgi:nucleoid-associated protein YgaU